MRTKLNAASLTGIDHKLRTWPFYFDEINKGEKRFEVRKNDRDFQKGDLLILQEYDPWNEKYTGAEIACEVTYVLHGKAKDELSYFGIAEGYCVMGIKKITEIVINNELINRNSGTQL